jgi:hypothetical protein
VAKICAGPSACQSTGQAEQLHTEHIAARKGDEVVTIKNIGGIVRESIPPGTRGKVDSAPWLGPLRVSFNYYDPWHGDRTVSVDVSQDEIVAVRS